MNIQFEENLVDDIEENNVNKKRRKHAKKRKPDQVEEIEIDYLQCNIYLSK